MIFEVGDEIYFDTDPNVWVVTKTGDIRIIGSRETSDGALFFANVDSRACELVVVRRFHEAMDEARRQKGRRHAL